MIQESQMLPQELPKTIDEVLAALDAIIAESVEQGNFQFVFAYVYRRTTAEIKKAVNEGKFQDNARMEAFDVSFANRYLEALQQFKTGAPLSKSWETAFLASNSPLLVIQHIMLGMNAHINLDLGVAAGLFAPGNQITGLKSDFMAVNTILKSLVNEMQDGLSSVSPLFFLLDWSGHNDDEAVIGFSIEKARDFAWNLAVTLAPLDAAAQAEKIAEVDALVAQLGDVLVHPPGRVLQGLLRLVGYFESKDARKILNGLARP
ncbi:MAG: hypothetical protein IPL65_14340 [Lewinellaceae bacterium]|nr:hypothetical protein [Lewinellaceae bacterium]